MEMFDYIKNIIFFKKPFKSENFEDIKQYNPFMVNRWISMHSGECANIINQTTNKKGYLGDDREMHYKLLLNTIPKNVYKRIEYIKKSS